MQSTWWHRLTSWSSKLSSRNGRPISCPRPAFRPWVEQLEDRCVPSLIVGPNVNISRVPGNQAEASMVINPTNPLNIVGFSVDLTASSGFRVYVSNDAGATWSSRIITNNDGLGVDGCCDAQAA